MYKQYVSLAITLLFFLSVSLLSAQVVEYAKDNFGTASTRENSSGFVEVTTEKVRTGSAAFKHIVRPPSSGETKRAELQLGGFSKFDPDQTFWYGFSLYLPSGQFPNSLELQFLGQLRFSNIAWAGYSTPNCFMYKECGSRAFYGGSGHELLYEYGELNFYLRHQEPGCADCEALDEVKLSLGTAPKDVWIDFIYQGTWTGNPDGFFNVWTQVDGGGYQQVVDYDGRSWVENHPPTSQLANQNNPWKPRVSAPNFTVGLYYNRDNANRYVYSDHITKYIQQPGVDGFAQVSVGGVSQPEACNRTGDSCNDGDPNTVNDKFNFNCECVGTSVAPTVSPAYLFVGKSAGSREVTVTSGTNWTVSDDRSWLSTDVSSGSGDADFKIFFGENSSNSDRTGTVNVSGGGKTSTVEVTQSGSSCGPTPWAASSFPRQNSDFTASFDLRPIGNNIQEPVFGITHTSNPDGFDDNAMLIQLASDGTFKVRDGGTYTSDVTLDYQQGLTYGVEVAVNKNAKTYSVVVDPPNGSPVAIASNYRFRSDWSGSFPLSHYTTKSNLTGCVSISNFSIGGQDPSCTVGASCNDGNAETENDKFDTDCNCVGVPTGGGGNDGGNGGGGSCTTVSFTPTDDAQVQSDKPNRNLGGTDRVRAFLRGNGRNAQGYFKWNLSSIPANATVSSASLSLESWNSGTVPVDLELREVSNDSWNETAITYNNRPNAGGMLATKDDIGPNQRWVVDVQSAIQGAVNTNRLFSANIQSTSIFGGPDWNQYADFRSSEGSQGTPVTLAVCYSSGPACTPGASCDDGDACTTGDAYDNDCECVGTFRDSDGDGICNADDTCNGNLAGRSCDDGDPRTVNDTYDSNCNCVGVPTGGGGNGGGGSCTTVSLTPTDDAQVQSDKPNRNLGGTDRVRAFLRGNGRNAQGYFKWNLSSIPANATVSSASLSLESWNSGTVPVDLELREVSNDSWNETAITYNNRPNAGGMLATKDDIGPNQRWVVDVQSAIQGAVNTNRLFSANIQSTSIFGGPDWNQYADFRSSEGSQGTPITLAVCYSSGPACTPGASCDDGDPDTTGDVYDGDCDCAGTPVGNETCDSYSGSIITDVSPWCCDRTADKAFDGQLSTFVDANVRTGTYLGLDFGSVKSVREITYASRPNFPQRMTGCRFQGSNDGNSWTNVHTITNQPPDNAYVTASVNASYRYMRFLSSADGSHGNIAELEFCGPNGSSLNGKTFGQSSTLSASLQFAADPNPIDGRLELTVPTGRVTIYNVVGQKMYEHGCEINCYLELSTYEWTPGLYLARHESPDGDIRTIKLIKQ